jgi:hypothetical protein
MKTRVRTVFGRRTFECDGKIYRIEMRAGAVVVRQKHARRTFTLPFSEIVVLSQGQRLLPLS